MDISIPLDKAAFIEFVKLPKELIPPNKTNATAIKIPIKEINWFKKSFFMSLISTFNSIISFLLFY